MVIFVKYHIPKEYFVKHKKEIKNILYDLAFKILVMKFEKGMSYMEIAKHHKLKALDVRKIISSSCERLRDGGHVF